MLRRIAYWGATALVGIVTLLAAFNYLIAAPEAVENFRHVISPAVAGFARHRQAGRSHRAASATAADPEGMSLRRLYLHVDRGSRGALSSGRRKVVVANRVARIAGDFVRHALGGSPRFRQDGAGVAGSSRRSRWHRGRRLAHVLVAPLIESEASELGTVIELQISRSPSTDLECLESCDNPLATNRAANFK